MAAPKPEVKASSLHFVLPEEYKKAVADLHYKASTDLIWEYCARFKINVKDCWMVDRAFQKPEFNALRQLKSYYKQSRQKEKFSLERKIKDKLKPLYKGNEQQCEDVKVKVAKMAKQFDHDERKGRFNEWLSKIKDKNGKLKDLSKYMDNFGEWKHKYSTDHRYFWTRQQLQEIGILDKDDQDAILNTIEAEQRDRFKAHEMEKWCFKQSIPFRDCEKLRKAKTVVFGYGDIPSRTRHLTSVELEKLGIDNIGAVLDGIDAVTGWAQFCKDKGIPPYKSNNIQQVDTQRQITDCNKLGEWTQRREANIISWSASFLRELGFTDLNAVQAVTRPEDHVWPDPDRWTQWCTLNKLEYWDCVALGKITGRNFYNLPMIEAIVKRQGSPALLEAEANEDIYGDLRYYGVADPYKALEAARMYKTKALENNRAPKSKLQGSPDENIIQQLGKHNPNVEKREIGKDKPAEQDPNQIKFNPKIKNPLKFNPQDPHYGYHPVVDNNPRQGREGQARQNEYNQYDLYYDDFHYDYGSDEPKQERGIGWIDNMDYGAGHKYDINVDSDGRFATSTIFGVGIVFGVVLMCCICLVFAGVSVVCYGVSKYINRYQFRFAKIGVESEEDQV